MCKECWQTPCAAGCPNAEPNEAVHECVECGEGIYEGDDYYDVGEVMCVDCVAKAKKRL